MAMIPRAFAALVCAIAIGAFAADLWFLDFFGPHVSFAALPLLSYAIVGALLVVGLARCCLVAPCLRLGAAK